MSQNIMDRYYRAVRRFSEQLTNADAPGNETEKKIRELFRRSGSETEKLSSVYFDVTIDETWLERIEAAMPHLEAAIREDRQFIKTEGNVTPIERVRKVSRTSVEHLSRHSEMITHVPEEGEDLIPDKLNVFENESNFAVYENRVLYMVLCYTRDFVDYRYYRISQAWKECRTEMEFCKSILTDGGPVTVEYRYKDLTNGLEDEENKNAGKLARLESVAAGIDILLSMPLMKNVALEPMVSTPITRTNVLRMDKHFKEVVALYDYLSNYTEDGFSLERHETNMAPFPEGLAKAAVELAMLGCFLSNEYGHDMEDILEKRYREEEDRRKSETRQRFAERVQAILGRAETEGATEEEYRELLAEAVSFGEEREEQIRKLNREAEMLRGGTEAAELRCAAMQSAVDRGRVNAEELRKQLSESRKECAAEADRLQAEISRVQGELETEQERIRVLEARVHGLLEEYGVKKPEADMTDREEFLELEKERDAFERFFERNWGVAKKKIRRRILWRKG